MKTHQDFLDQFNDERKSLVEEMLQAIHEECPTLTETIKWNAPTFCHGGKDRMTIMLHKKDRVGLILHTGARPKEDKKAPPCILTILDCSNGIPIFGLRLSFPVNLTSFQKERFSSKP